MNHCLFKAKDTKGAVGNTVDYSSLTFIKALLDFFYDHCPFRILAAFIPRIILCFFSGRHPVFGIKKTPY